MIALQMKEEEEGKKKAIQNQPAFTLSLYINLLHSEYSSLSVNEIFFQSLVKKRARIKEVKVLNNKKRKVEKYSRGNCEYRDTYTYNIKT
jgi:hypothetical protein